MKHKLYIVLAAFVLIGLVILIVVIANGPTKATNPRNDYSRSRSPGKQVLSGSTNLQVSSAMSAATVSTAPKTNVNTPAGQPITAHTPTSVSIKSVGVANHSTTNQTVNSTYTATHPASKPSKQGKIEVMLQSLSNLQL